MKLNFWQWLGVVLLILGAAYYIWEKNAAKPSNPVAPTTQKP